MQTESSTALNRQQPPVTVVIPTHNEEQTISSILHELIKLGFTDIIVVDDGSQDRTAQAARDAGAQVLRHPYKVGNGAAIKSGIRAATGDIILLMDGDGQHPPADVLGLLALLDSYDMVVGARASASQIVYHRRMANKLFNRYASYLVGHSIPDLTSGFRVVRADILRKFLYLLPNGFSYPSTLTIAMFHSGYRVRYEPFVAPTRTVTSISKIRPLHDGLFFLLTITRLGVLFMPLKIFLPVSILLGIFGAAYGAYSLIFLMNFSDTALVLILASLITFLIGLVAEQNAAMHLALSKLSQRDQP